MPATCAEVLASKAKGAACLPASFSHNCRQLASRQLWKLHSCHRQPLAGGKAGRMNANAACPPEEPLQAPDTFSLSHLRPGTSGPKASTPPAVQTMGSGGDARRVAPATDTLPARGLALSFVDASRVPPHPRPGTRGVQAPATGSGHSSRQRPGLQAGASHGHGLRVAGE